MLLSGLEAVSALILPTCFRLGKKKDCISTVHRLISNDTNNILLTNPQC